MELLSQVNQTHGGVVELYVSAFYLKDILCPEVRSEWEKIDPSLLRHRFSTEKVVDKRLLAENQGYILALLPLFDLFRRLTDGFASLGIARLEANHEL